MLDQIVDARLRRGLTTVIDTHRARARPPRRVARHGSSPATGPAHLVVLDVPEREARARNKARAQPGALEDRHHPAAHARRPPSTPSPPRASTPCTTSPATSRVVLVPPRFLTAPASARTQRRLPCPSASPSTSAASSSPARGPQLADNLRRLARAAEEAGFHGISVMDHVVQIPGVGARVGGHAREHDRARVPRRRHRAPPRRRPGERRDLPEPGPAREAGRHPRRAVRRAGVLRARAGVERAGARALRLGLPAGAPSATSSSRTPSSCSRSCGARARRGSRAAPSPCPRRCATRARSRSASRSSSGDRASSARCGSSPATPTAATCSATPT